MNAPPRARPRSMPGALILSVAAHGLLVAFAVPAAPSDAAQGDGLTGAHHAGVTDLGAIEYPIETTLAPPGPKAPEAPAKAAEEAPKPAEKAPVAAAKPPVVASPPKVEDPYADLDAKPSEPADVDAPDPDETPPEPPPKAAKTDKKPSKTAQAAPSAGGSLGDEASPPPLGGAQSDGASANGGELGGQGGAGDLGRAFTRAIPIACQADGAWGDVGVGAAGSMRARISISADGHVEGFEPLSPNPPQVLVGLIRRTLAMLRGGTFAVSPGSVSAGTNELRVTAVVSDSAQLDPDTSAAGLAFEYENGKGRASFVQTAGRRVDVKVELLSVLVGPP